MAHAGDLVELHRRPARRVVVDAERGAARQRLGGRRGLPDAPHVRPLVAQLGAVDRVDGVVGGALPDRHPRPRPRVARVGGPYFVAQLGGRQVDAAVLAGGRGGLRGRALRGQARVDRAAREDVRIVGQQVGGHAAARGKTRDEDPAAVRAVLRDRVRHHRDDRGRLALAAGVLGRVEPAEAGQRVVRRAGLRQHQGEAPQVGVLLPAGVGEVVARRLRAAVQRDHHGGAGRQPGGRVLVHREVARVRAEGRHLGQARSRGGLRARDGAQTGRDQREHPGHRAGDAAAERGGAVRFSSGAGEWCAVHGALLWGDPLALDARTALWPQTREGPPCPRPGSGGHGHCGTRPPRVAAGRGPRARSPCRRGGPRDMGADATTGGGSMGAGHVCALPQPS
ncbi:putative L-seryl-tRNA(Sec) selenium transferase [Actinacidiphila bryophytorum]|uniref:L-seryl-tRNA(Sec) selenium transferase n=1 Tax=Actinacidiphila bryophytorum TaxID=1436133 RepID=A0A9W4MKM1_9ACTN|nr:putative L-seryl-tRNA(Sec) selenium transferase [Actinacidiphila bryophytorum]